LKEFDAAAASIEEFTKRASQPEYEAAVDDASKRAPLSATALAYVRPELEGVQHAIDQLRNARLDYDSAPIVPGNSVAAQQANQRHREAQDNWYAKARAVVESVHLTHAPPLPPLPLPLGEGPSADGASCKAYAEYKDDADGRGWLLGAFDLPSTDFDHTVQVRADRLLNKAVKMPVDSAIGVWATHSPVENKSFGVSITGQSTRHDPVQILASFFSAIVPKPPSPNKAGGGESNIATVAALADWLVKLTSSQCARPAGIQDPSQPLAPLRSWAKDVAGEEGQGLQRDWTYTVRSCYKPPCSQSGTDFGVVTMTAPPGVALTLLGAFTYGWNTNGSSYATDFLTYQWRPTSPGAGEQTFSLDTVPQPGASIAASLLLTLLLDEGDFGRFGIGVGPSLIDGTASSLQQWTANLAWRPKSWVSDSLYLVGGFGFRLVNVPLSYVPGATVTLPFGTGNTPPSAPILATRTDFAPVLTFGIGIDLSVLGAAANTIFGSNITINQPAADPKKSTDSSGGGSEN
jgi:hypothetical protein